MPATPTARRGASSRTSKKRLISPDDLHQMRFVAAPRISPDGETIVFTRKHIDAGKNKYVTNLWTVDASGESEPVQFTNGGKDGAACWSPDGATIAFVGERTEGRPQIHIISADGGEARPLTDLPEGSIGAVRWSPDGTVLAVQFREQDPEWTEAAKKDRKEHNLSDPPRVLDHWWYRLDGDGYFNAQRYHLYIVDADTGAARKVYDKDTMGFFTFDFSPDSRKLVIGTNRDRRAGLGAWSDELLVLDVRSGKIRSIDGLPPGPKAEVKWSPDGKWIAYAGNVHPDGTYGTENLELWVCDPRSGKARSLTAKEDYCLMAPPATDTAEIEFWPSLQWSPDSRRIFMKIGWHGEGHIASVRRAGGPVVMHTKGPYDHTMGTISADGRSMALTRGSAAAPPEVHVGHLGTREAMSTTALSAFNAEYLRGVHVAKITSHWVKTDDGTRVHTWVMMPPRHARGSRSRYPAVLEIHGGPHAQYGIGFFHEFQVLAANGYAVFFSNPRGSKGYGRDHCHAIRGHWGSADWVDIQAVTEFMKAHRNVDARRMGVMGGSYGGYMTNWVIGHTRDFAGAITDRCVSNVVSLGSTGDFIDPIDQYFPGNFWDRTEERWEQSPIKHIGKAKTPTLIIHSEGDLRCNVAQAEQIHAALTLLKVPTRFVRYPRSTSHGMSRSGPPDMRLHRLGQIVDWWRRYLK